MRATVMYRAGDVRIENVPDAAIRVVRACICGSDLWPYKDLEPTEGGDIVIMPFAYSDGSCEFCTEGLLTSCVHGGFFGVGGPADGAQAEAYLHQRAAARHSGRQDRTRASVRSSIDSRRSA